MPRDEKAEDEGYIYTSLTPTLLILIRILVDDIIYPLDWKFIGGAEDGFQQKAKAFANLK